MSKPLSAEEIAELLGATLHGPLPEETQRRVMSTLAAHAALLNNIEKTNFFDLTTGELSRFAPDVFDFWDLFEGPDLKDKVNSAVYKHLKRGW